MGSLDRTTVAECREGGCNETICGGKYVELEKRVLTNYNDGHVDHWFGREWVRKL